MARTITILPEHLAGKIAAGEVIQRPASAVKELLENSIDAGAKAVTVILKDAGRTLLQVIDDGCGMSEEDAAVAFQRHATSKIATEEDLENIRTLGFRGEALASIATVAQVELKTRQRSADVGIRVRIEGGVLLDVTETAAPPGTSIAVKNLFYNTPGRRKFLKTDATELRHVADVVQRAALSHATLAVNFISDDETILALKPGSPRERLADIFGENLSKGLIEFSETPEAVTIGGFLGRPDFARRSRIEQYLFMNGRPIVNRSLNHAVFQAYEHLLEKGSFPFFVLSITIDPAKVDVNVHPTKTEVKFADEQSVYRAVAAAVRKALSASDLIPLTVTREGISRGPRGQVAASPLGLRFATGSVRDAALPRQWEQLFQGGPPSGGTAPSEGSPPGAASPGEQEAGGAPRLSADIPLWQVHNKYILLPTEGGVMIIDQHAAHERVLYERTVERFNDHRAKSQQLLFPHTLEMPPSDAQLVRQLLPLLEDLGFTLKIFGKTTIIIDGVPIDVRPGEEKTILGGVLDLYKEDEGRVTLEPRERLAKSFSCRAAIKAGDPLRQEEIRSLLDQLFATELPFVCPHGRPVIVKLSMAELDRRFGRSA
jgi:DNA mismatch repair protein MutL